MLLQANSYEPPGFDTGFFARGEEEGGKSNSDFIVVFFFVLAILVR